MEPEEAEFKHSMAVSFHIIVNFPSWSPPDLGKYVVIVSPVQLDRGVYLGVELFDLPGQMLLALLTCHLALAVGAPAVY